MTPGLPLPRSFYRRHPTAVARDLLGMELLFHRPEGWVGGYIVEAEAYHGRLDAASHAYRGLTARNAVMFGPPGHAYIYFTYGMHHCFNVVVADDGEAAAVLIRAVQPSRGSDVMRVLREQARALEQGVLPLRDLTSGPGRLCQAYGLSRAQNGLDLTAPPLLIAAPEQPLAPQGGVVVTTRIGVTRDAELPWRFYVAGNPFVSRRDRFAENLGDAACANSRYT
jgi:DNA-3-methyladenine glycosylase